MRIRRNIGAGLFISMIILLGWVLSGSTNAQSGELSGVVMDSVGPVAGAHVRVRATNTPTVTGDDGRFLLEVSSEGQEVEITAWAPGYYIAYTFVTPPDDNITLTLRPYHTEDNPDYGWTFPEGEEGDGESGACGNCHPMIISQWANNAHGTAISNPRFFSMYNGTDVKGEKSIGFGYLDDFPDTAGHCASCHAPGAAVDGYFATNMNDVRGDVTAGIHCDYCHKIGGVYLNPATQMPYPNVPGVESQRVLRPPEGDNIFFGPYEDIHDPDTYLPIISESAFCAPCHEFSMWGTPIYESYSEWLNSPYANANVTCQDCHMPPTGDTMFALAEVGGLEHPPESIPSHLQVGAVDVDLLQNTVEMVLDVEIVDRQAIATVTLNNFGAGHHVPTDYPGRHMILLVNAQDQAGQTLELIHGPTVPDWGGPEAGLPGQAFAKVLRDVMTGEMPVVSYWEQTQIVSDNRIPALESDRTTYIFSLPETADSEVLVSAELIFRRLFHAESEARKWNMPDIMMENTVLQVPINESG